MTLSMTAEEKKLLERILKRGGATLVVKDGGETQITVYFNTARFRDSRVRHA
jgi:hypothetical protein